MKRNVSSLRARPNESPALVRLYRRAFGALHVPFATRSFASSRNTYQSINFDPEMLRKIEHSVPNVPFILIVFSLEKTVFFDNKKRFPKGKFECEAFKSGTNNYVRSES